MPYGSSEMKMGGMRADLRQTELEKTDLAQGNEGRNNDLAQGDKSENIP